MYTVRFSDAALKKLKKMYRYQVSLLVGWIEKNLMNCSDLRNQVKAVVANLREKWRYWVDDYRILALIEDEEIITTIIDVNHRKNIYD